MNVFQCFLVEFLEFRTVSSSSELLSFLLSMCGRIVLVSRFGLVFFPHVGAHKDCVLEVRTFELTPCDGLFLSQVFTWCNVPLERVTVQFDSNVPLFRRIDFFGGAVSWNTQFRCSSASVCLNRHMSPKLHPDSELYF